jgi:hypothetical protein
VSKKTTTDSASVSKKNISAEKPEPSGTNTNVKHPPKRWTLSNASLEFSCDVAFLAKRLRRTNQIPGEDARYSTMQIVKAIYGDIEKERARKIKEDADRAEMANGKLKKRLVTRDNALKFVAKVAMKVRGIIQGSSLEERDKADIYLELQTSFDEKSITSEICPEESFEDLLEMGKGKGDEEED